MTQSEGTLLFKTGKLEVKTYTFKTSQKQDGVGKLAGPHTKQGLWDENLD